MPMYPELEAKRRTAYNKYASHLESIYLLLGKEYRELTLDEVQKLLDLTQGAETNLKELKMWDGVIATEKAAEMEEPVHEPIE